MYILVYLGECVTARRLGQTIEVVGDGVIGLSLALELHQRGHEVRIVERQPQAGQASWAAAGMLAGNDPHHPAELRDLAAYSAGLYPGFLRQLRALGGVHVPWQTDVTWQYDRNGQSVRLDEHSIDPRQLLQALRAATHAARISWIGQATDAALPSTHVTVHANGAWFGSALTGLCAVRPRKGQMLRVRVPEGLTLNQVHRSEQVYIVPRTQGDQAGSALIGATVEDVGFDLTLHPADLRNLRAMAAQWVPELGNEHEAPLLDAWAGLRPATADGLPVLGEVQRAGSARVLVATGHFRNGILLAPATARLMADQIEHKQSAVDLSPFSVDRQ